MVEKSRNGKNSKQETNYFLHIKEVDVKLFGLNAAAILAVIKAGEKWRKETNVRNKKANDIAEQHGDARWLSEDVSLGFTNQDFIDRTFGLCGRNAVIEAVKKLISSGVVTQHSNPNKKYSSDKSRYFKFNQDVYRCLKQRLRDEEEAAEETTPDSFEQPEAVQSLENIDRLNLNDAPFNNKREEEGDNPKINGARLNLNGTRLNSGLHIMNSNNNYKNINNHSLNASEENFEPEKNHSSDLKTDSPLQTETKEIVGALIAKGMPSQRFYADGLAVIASLNQAGATREMFLQAFDKAERSTQAGNFGVNYLAKIIRDLLAKANKSNVPKNKPPPQAEKDDTPVYENDYTNGLHWMGDLV